MKSKDYMPHAESDLVIWCGNFKTFLAVHAGALGLTPAQIAALNGALDGIVAEVANVAAKRAALNEAFAQKATALENDEKSIRELVSVIKTSAGYTPAIGESLGIIGGSSEFDSENYKASISASIVAGCVRIKFTKKGVDGINIYHRRKGTAKWNFLARDTKSPYDDHIELAVAGQPEHWEYRAYGVIDDTEIGQPSDIVEIVFGE